MKTKRQISPLRRVVGMTKNKYNVPMEQLECGHVQHVRQDHIGPYYATKRRCLNCFLGNPTGLQE